MTSALGGSRDAIDQRSQCDVSGSEQLRQTFRAPTHESEAHYPAIQSGAGPLSGTFCKEGLTKSANYQRMSLAKIERPTSVTIPQPTVYQTVIYRASSDGQAKTKRNAPQAADPRAAARDVANLSIGAPRRRRIPSAITRGAESATIFQTHCRPIGQSSRFNSSPNPSCMRFTSQPVVKISEMQIASHRDPARGDFVGSAETRATVTLDTAITPMLVIFHQNEGISIALCISGRIRPAAKKAASSTALMTQSTMASQRRLRGCIGLRSRDSASSSVSVRIVVPQTLSNCVVRRWRDQQPSWRRELPTRGRRPATPIYADRQLR